MKLFISADIEGCAGVTLASETSRQESAYKPFADQMTREVVALCEVALDCGVTEIVVKDGHGDGANIDIMKMPKGVTLIRGKSGHPSNMMFGLDDTFDAVMYLGYHSAAGQGSSPLSHTSTGNSNYIMVNGKPLSEFRLNSYTAAMYGVPIIFLSGDRGICEEARALIPNIRTVETKVGVGASAFCKSPETVIESLKDEAEKALRNDFSTMKVEMPNCFEYEVNYKDLKKAYQMSFFPNMKAVDDRRNILRTENWIDVLTAHSFVVY